MKKILYVTTVSRTINSFFLPHLDMLVDEGYEVACAAKNEEGSYAISNKLNKKIKFFDIPFTRNPLSLQNIKAYKMLCKIQEENNYDIIHVHTPIASVYARLLKRKFKNVKLVYTAHGFHFFKGSSKSSWIIYHTIEKYLSKYTDVLVTINNEDYNVAKGFNAKNVVKINGVGIDFSSYKKLSQERIKEIRDNMGLDDDDFVLVMIGEHNVNKNQIQLIKALQNLQNDYPKIKGIFLGDGELFEENKKYVEENNITNAKLLGFRKDVNDMINISDVLVSMSYREGLPKNILEAMACGKPVIGTPIRGTSDLIENEKNGLLVGLNDVKGTEEAILELYNKNEEDLQEMRAISLEKSKDYDMNHILEHLKKIYEDVLSV